MRACARAGGGVALPPPKLATALLGLERISQLFKVHIEHLFRAGPVMSLSVIWSPLVVGKKLAFLLRFLR